MKLGCHNRPELIVKPGIWLYIAIIVLLIPLRWLLAAVISIIIHESFHIVAIKSMNIPIRAVKIGVDGIQIHTREMSSGQELLCALAGPLGGVLLVSLAKFMPATAICAGIHTLFNLLPIHPQDGGRVLRCALSVILPDRCVYLICLFAEYICLFFIGILGVYATVSLKLGILPVVFATLCVCRSMGLKNSLQRG